MSNQPIVYNSLINPDLHKSLFENDGANVKLNTQYNRTLLSVREEREQSLTGDTGLKNLSSPGTYNLTENDESVSGSNTSHLFKNLYGETLLTFLFFSSDNIENLQNHIRFLVYKNTDQIIDKQSNNELMIIMRSIFLSYSSHPLLIDSTMSDNQKNILLKQYTDEINKLNELCLNEIVPRVVSQLQAYLDYLKDCSNPRKIMEKPISDNRTGMRQLRSVLSVLAGSDL